MARSKALSIAGGLLVAIGFSIAIGNYFYLGYVEENAKLLILPEVGVLSDSVADASSDKVRLLERELELVRDRSVELHATLMTQIRRERRNARDNALLWFAAMLLFGVIASRGAERQQQASKHNAA